MPRPGFDTDQNRCLAGMRVLQGGGEFETVAGDNAVVGVSRGHECGRVFGPLFDIVVRRIGQQSFELVGIIGRAVIVDPETAGGA